MQTITRKALLKKIAEVVKNLPDDRLQQVWEQVNSWGTMVSARVEDKAGHSRSDDQEIIEFGVTPRQGTPEEQFVRLPVRSKGPTTPAIMEVSESTYDTSGYMQRLQANIEWWNQNFDRIQQDSSLYNSYVAISDGVVFFADSYLDAYKKTREVQTDGNPYIFFLKSPNQPTKGMNIC
jgi:hypothetical protein